MNRDQPVSAALLGPLIVHNSQRTRRELDAMLGNLPLANAPLCLLISCDNQRKPDAAFDALGWLALFVQARYSITHVQLYPSSSAFAQGNLKTLCLVENELFYGTERVASGRVIV